MTSVVPSVQTPTTGLVQGSQAPTQVLVQKSGNTLPQDGKVSATAAAAQPTVGQPQSRASAVSQQQSEATQQAKEKQVQEQKQGQQQAQKTDVAQQVAVFNKFLNESGRAAQFRASADSKTVEEVNPATGEVVAQYSAITFEALARSVGITGEPVVDEHA